MAEPWTLAFGRYLRALRERRGLSLQEVSVLSQPFADKVHKGYLSRCENGLQRISFSKIIPLSRIYEVPADVLLERMELDMELDRIGGPDTSGKTFRELRDEFTPLLRQGYKWGAYAVARDAIIRSPEVLYAERYRSLNEQIAEAWMLCAMIAKSLGRVRLALHEVHAARAFGPFNDAFQAVLLERLSICHRSLNNLAEAVVLAEESIVLAESAGDPETLAFVYNNRARLANETSDHALAAEWFQKSYRAFASLGDHPDVPTILNNLAQCYFNMKRYRAARRTLRAAEQLSKSLDQRRTFGLSQILLGELDEIDNNPELAAKRWRAVAESAKELNDRELRFKAEYVLFRQAVNLGNIPAARSIERRLRRLAPWMAPDLEEVRLFRDLASSAQELMRA